MKKEDDAEEQRLRQKRRREKPEPEQNKTGLSQASGKKQGKELPAKTEASNRDNKSYQRKTGATLYQDSRSKDEHRGSIRPSLLPPSILRPLRQTHSTPLIITPSLKLNRKEK